MGEVQSCCRHTTYWGRATDCTDASTSGQNNTISVRHQARQRGLRIIPERLELGEPVEFVFPPDPALDTGWVGDKGKGVHHRSRIVYGILQNEDSPAFSTAVVPSRSAQLSEPLEDLSSEGDDSEQSAHGISHLKVVVWCLRMDPELVYDGTEQDMARRRVEVLRLADNLLNHWNSLSKVSSVGQVHGFTRKGNELCLVRARYESLLADQMMQLGGTPMPGPQLVRMACELAHGLKVLHARDVVVANLNPYNVAVGDDGRLKICDAGVAELAARMGIVPLNLGEKVRYESPEACAAAYEGNTVATSELQPSVDVWSFACIVLQLATGTRPYCQLATDQVEGVRTAAEAGLDLPFDAAVAPNLPAHLVDLLQQCLRPKGKDRPSAHKLYIAFETVWELCRHVQTVREGVQATDTLDPDRTMRVLDATHTLRELAAATTPEARAALAWAGGENLAETLRRTQAHVVMVLSTIACEPTVHTELVSAGIVRLLMGLLQAGEEAGVSAPVKERAAATLARLCQSRSVGAAALDAVVHAGGVATLIALLREEAARPQRGPRTRDIQSCASVLAHLARRRERCEEIVAADGVEHLLRLLQRPSLRAAATEHVVGALAEVAEHSGSKVKAQVSSSEAMALLVGMVREHAGAVGFATKLKAARLLCTLASHRDSRNRLVEAGGLEALVELLHGEWMVNAQHANWRKFATLAARGGERADGYESDASDASGASGPGTQSHDALWLMIVKSQAVAALSHLASCDAKHSARIVAAGGIPLLVTQLEDDSVPELAYLRYAAAKTDDPVLDGYQEAPPSRSKQCSLSSSMWNIKATAAKALAVLAHRSAKNRVAIATADGIPALLDTLTRKDAPLFMKGLAAATLGILTWEPDVAAAAVAEGGTEALVALMHDAMRSPPDVRAAAATALASLAKLPTCRSVLGQTAGVELLMLLVRDERINVRHKESAMRALSLLVADSEHRVTLVKLGAITDLCTLLRCKEGTPTSTPASSPTALSPTLSPRDEVLPPTLPPPAITKLVVATLDKLTEEDQVSSIEQLVQAGGVELLHLVLHEGAPESKLCAACLLQKVPEERVPKKHSMQALSGVLVNSAQFCSLSMRTLLNKAKLSFDVNGSDYRMPNHVNASLIALNKSQPIPIS